MVSRFAEEANAQWAERQAAVRMAGGEESYLQALRLQKYFDKATAKKQRQEAQQRVCADTHQNYPTPVLVEGLGPRQPNESVMEYKIRVKQELQRRRDNMK